MTGDGAREAADGQVREGGCWPLLVHDGSGWRSLCGCGWISRRYPSEVAAGSAPHLVGRIDDADPTGALAALLA